MTDEERRAALYAPKIRDERITPGCHKYKPPVRGLAYRGSVEGMTYKHRKSLRIELAMKAHSLISLTLLVTTRESQEARRLKA